MPVAMETTVHDMKTHFSQYSAALLAGDYDEIVVKNRTLPILRVTRYEEPQKTGLKLGIAKERGMAPIDFDLFDELDTDIAADFAEYL